MVAQLVVQHVLPPTVLAAVPLSAALHVASRINEQLACPVAAFVLKFVLWHAVQDPDAVAPAAVGRGCVYVFAGQGFVVPAVALAAHQWPPGHLLIVHDDVPATQK